MRKKTPNPQREKIPAGIEYASTKREKEENLTLLLTLVV